MYINRKIIASYVPCSLTSMLHHCGCRHELSLFTLLRFYEFSPINNAPNDKRNESDMQHNVRRFSCRSPYRDYLSRDSDSTRDHSHRRHLNPTRLPPSLTSLRTWLLSTCPELGPDVRRCLGRLISNSMMLVMTGSLLTSKWLNWSCIVPFLDVF